MNLQQYNEERSNEYLNGKYSCMRCGDFTSNNLCDGCLDIKIEDLGLEKILYTLSQKQKGIDYYDASFQEALMDKFFISENVADEVLNKLEEDGFIDFEVSPFELDLSITEKGNQILN